ncbi:MAG: AMP-binding protein [Arachnia propionica]|uniref:AMP-binding protein n=1 Tax=Arachnia propionica TaxID=1750 RepID=UPI0026F4ACF5|nr:AMP-binding protein [Arachnia propionica]
MSTHDIERMLDGGAPLWFDESPRPEIPGHLGAVVATSGTTGSRRLVALSRHALLAAADSAIQHAGTLTWHLALPPHHVAGLMVAVRSLRAGRPVPEAGPDLAGLRPTGCGDAISLVPTQLHRALTDPVLTGRLAAFDLVLVGGAALGDELRERSEAARIKVVESYGMSETCGGVVWDGHPLPGVGIGIDDGRVTVTGPMLFDGYLGDPEATAAALVAGRLLTRDRGHLLDGRLHIDGRIDDIVISGGVNIDLAEVRAAVTRLAPEAAVIAVPDPEWGCRIVVMDQTRDLDWWRTTLADHLPRTWLPRQHLGHPVPLTGAGKPDRAAMTRLAEAEHTTMSSS